MGKTVAEKFFTPRKISEDHGTLRSALSKMARRAPGESVTLTDQEIRALMEDREHPHLITTAKDTYVIAQKQACIHVEQQWPDVVPDDHERDKAPVFVQVEMMSVRAAADVRVWFNFKTDEWIFERVVVRDHDKPEEWKVVGRCDAWDGEEAK